MSFESITIVSGGRRVRTIRWRTSTRHVPLSLFHFTANPKHTLYPQTGHLIKISNFSNSCVVFQDSFSSLFFSPLGSGDTCVVLQYHGCDIGLMSTVIPFSRMYFFRTLRGITVSFKQGRCVRVNLFKSRTDLDDKEVETLYVYSVKR